MELSNLRRGAEYLISELISIVFGAPRRKISVRNGIAVRNCRLPDPNDVEEDYEDVLITFVRNAVDSGDSVIVVGGGLGVSTVVAAKNCGPEGEVTAFEGSRHRYQIGQETMVLNKVEEQTTVKHAIVGTGKNLFADSQGAGHVEPIELPECDVLVMDCEGTEAKILSELKITPRKIVVESHGVMGSPPTKIRSELHDRGYRIEDEGVVMAKGNVLVHHAMRESGSLDKAGKVTEI